LLLLLSCALAGVKRKAAVSESAINSFQWFLFTGPNPGAEAFIPLFPKVRSFHVVLLAQLLHPSRH
jgi:hypothetical protein